MLSFLHVLLTFIHICLIVYNVFGGFLRRYWFLHWLTVHLTLFSWIGMGYWYGWGYCILTDWHWQIREHLGEIPQYSSFLSYLLFTLLGIPPFPEKYIDYIAIGGLGIGFLHAEWNLIRWYCQKKILKKKKL